MSQLQVPQRLGTRCQLGIVMWNFLGYRHVQDQIDAAIAAIPMREVEVNGVKYMQLDEKAMEARS